MSERPPQTKAVGDNLPRCPWCDAWLDDARVKLEDVFSSIALIDGAAQLFALPVDCPECAKPMQIEAKVTHNTARSWAIGVRTKADKALLGETP